MFERKIDRALRKAKQVIQVLENIGSQNRAEDLTEKAQEVSQERFTIGVVGQAKRGKSTLVNAWLGKRDDSLAPIDMLPATNVVSVFGFAEKTQARVLFSEKDRSPLSIDPAEIRNFVCEKGNPGNHKGAKSIEILGPFTNLDQRMVLVDTPGADNALSTIHDMVLIDYLPRLDAVVFLVTADEPLIESEMELLRNVKSSDVGKILFAMNKADKVDEDELAEAIDHNRKSLETVGLGDARIHVMSAKNSYLGEGDEGTERLLSTVNDMISNGRENIIAQRLEDMASRQLMEVKEELATSLAAAGKDDDELENEIAILQKSMKDLEKDGPSIQRKFRRDWRDAFDQFENSLSTVQCQLEREVREKIEKASSLRLPALGKTIHTEILKCLDDQLEPRVQELHNKIDQLVRSLQLDYCDKVGLAPREAEALLNRKYLLSGALDLAFAGAMPTALGLSLQAMPGIVGSAISATAPEVIALSWNPATWIPWATSSGSAAVISGTSTVATTALAPIAFLGSLLYGYAAYRVISTWREKKHEERNTLILGSKDLIRQAIDETRRNIKRLREKDEEILRDLEERLNENFHQHESQLRRNLENKTEPEILKNFEDGIKVIENLALELTEDSSESASLNPDAPLLP